MSNARTTVLCLSCALGACGEGVLLRDAGPDAGPAADALPWSFPDAGSDAEPPPPPEPEPCPRVVITVAGGGKVTVRRRPARSSDAVGLLFDGTLVKVRAISPDDDGGEQRWYQIAAGAFEGYLPPRAARCTEQQPPPFAGFYLPLPCRERARVTQGNHGGYSHDGDSAYAFDISLAPGTRVVAMAPGTISLVYDRTGPGDPCYSGGGSSCAERANRVWIEHPDQTQTIYAHLSRVFVQERQQVMQGQVIGLSGSTGYSSGPHLHAARMRSCCQTIRLRFEDVRGDGVPATGDAVVSGNCP